MLQMRRRRTDRAASDRRLRRTAISSIIFARRNASQRLPLSKTVPLADQYSLSLQHGYNVIQQGMVPVPGSGAHATRTSETDQSAKLSVFDTGTSVSVSQTMTSSDEKWLRRIGAEQKVWDGLSVSGSVGETGNGATSKSVSAGFKRSW